MDPPSEPRWRSCPNVSNDLPRVTSGRLASSRPSGHDELAKGADKQAATSTEAARARKFVLIVNWRLLLRLTRLVITFDVDRRTLFGVSMTALGALLR